MLKTELHFHTSPVSVCSRLTASDAAEKYSKCGFQALMLTNHYSRSNMERTGASEREWRENFVKAYYDMTDAAKNYGMRVFFGAEVTLFAPYSLYMREKYSAEYLAANYADYIILGLTEKTFLETPLMCDLDLKELHSLCSDIGALVVQAHPFRTEQNHSLKDVAYLDGLEINGNVGFTTANEEKVLDVAQKNNLIVTCGGDTHYDWHVLRSATFIPDSVTDSVMLASYLKKVRVPEYSLSEPDPFAPPRC